MPTVSKHSYILKRGLAGKPTISANTTQDFFLPKYDSRNRFGVNLGYIILPETLAGRRVRFKVEIVQD